MGDNAKTGIDDMDVLIAWAARGADATEIPQQHLPDLTPDEKAAFDKATARFLADLNSGSLVLGEEIEPPVAPDRTTHNGKARVRPDNYEPVGLNRSQQHDELTSQLLEKRRAEIREDVGDPIDVASVDDSDSSGDIEEITAKILNDLGLWSLPVDPMQIATEEGIRLCADLFGDGFDARIEYYSDLDEFAIFHQRPRYGHTVGRVNFSVAHELGHYYLHSRYLLSGKSHNSSADYRSKDPMEVEADAFAAAILMPRELFKAEVRKLRREICTLSDICKLAKEHFRTSVTSTALRYLRCDFEACAIVMSKAGRVVWADYSTDMKQLGMKYIPFGDSVPKGSWSAEVDASNPEDFQEGEIDAEIWFDYPKRPLLWEEAMTLGSTQYVLSFLTLPDPELE